MKMFQWTVGSFYVFGEKWDLTCFISSQIQVSEKTHIFMLIVYLQRSIMVLTLARLCVMPMRPARFTASMVCFAWAAATQTGRQGAW